MKGALISSFFFAGLIATCLVAQPSIETQEVNQTAQLPLACYLKDLEEQGYCVIPQLFSSAETEILYQRVWKEYIEKAWPDCKMEDRSNWEEVFPKLNPWCIFVGHAGQTQVMWDLRQDPRIVDLFANVWNTHDLIVSMDGLSLMCPPEIREGYFEPWPHVDQGAMAYESESSLQTNPFTIQGQFLFEDSFEGDGGFYCIPKSHLRFDEVIVQLEALEASDASAGEIWQAQQGYLRDFFKQESDACGQAYEMKQITAPRGSLILWDSRTVHWSQYPSKNRPHREYPRVRMVGYLCYVPKARLTDEAIEAREKAFETGATMTHNPTDPSLRYNKSPRYPEDSSYVHPAIELTPLGQSLLN